MQPQNSSPVQPPAPQHDYQFIINPPAAQKGARFSLPGGSLARRLVIALGGLLVLIIVFSLVKSLFGSNTNFTPYITVAQDQQAIIHLSSNASLQPGLNITNRNFAITAKLSLTSDESQLITYLKNSHQKVGSKTLNQKISLNLDSQLTAATSNSTYDTTFQQIMQSQLNNYIQALKKAYTGSGNKGKALLSSEYNGAQLLLQQLTPTS